MYRINYYFTRFFNTRRVQQCSSNAVFPVKLAVTGGKSFVTVEQNKSLYRITIHDVIRRSGETYKYMRSLALKLDDGRLCGPGSFKSTKPLLSNYWPHCKPLRALAMPLLVCYVPKIGSWSAINVQLMSFGSFDWH